MEFFVGSALILPQVGASQCYLIRDSWDDWFSFDTRYQMYVFDLKGVRHSVGELKIGQAGLHPASASDSQNLPMSRSPSLSEKFPALSDNFFSLGQEDNYYEVLNTLGHQLRETILVGLRDCAHDLSIYRKFENEPVMGQSLMRYITEENLLNRFHRLAHGNATLTRYRFDYILPHPPDASPAKMSFVVEPNSEPPTNVHVLIGRNGVGKSRCIQSLTATVLDLENQPNKGRLIKREENAEEWSFSGLVHVSFSAFDTFDFPPTQTQEKIRGTFVGLSNLTWSPGANSASALKELLGHQFLKSFEVCRSGLRANRWIDAIQSLCSDPMFEEANIIDLLTGDDATWQDQAMYLFKKLSSGHAIVLLTMTKLVELVDERTLVILDEPEGHLHPPLLSAFIRSVSKLLIERNGVAIIATHSPVILQEVPASCVSVLSRAGAYSEVSPPELETFGEAVGTLTREVFGLEVTHAGFHALIHQQVANGLSFEDIFKHFNGKLGTEAQLLARSLAATRQAENGGKV